MKLQTESKERPFIIDRLSKRSTDEAKIMGQMSRALSDAVHSQIVKQRCPVELQKE